MQEATIPDAFDELVEYFHGLLETAAETVPLAIFIDSLDQLSDEDAGRSQPWKWIPKELPRNIYFVISTLPDTEYGILQELSEIHPRTLLVPLLPAEDSISIFDAWMKQYRRTLSEQQKQTALQCPNELKSGISMLHLRLICDRASQWSSQHVPDPIPRTVQGLIDQIYAELEKEHGEKLVRRFLSLLVASKDSLSFNNIIDIISADEDALGGKGKEGTVLEKYEPPIRRAPPVLLARLMHDLRDYIVERGANGMKVLGLYHRQFIEVVKRRYLQCVHYFY